MLFDGAAVVPGVAVVGAAVVPGVAVVGSAVVGAVVGAGVAVAVVLCAPANVMAMMATITNKKTLTFMCIECVSLCFLSEKLRLHQFEFKVSK